MSEMIERVARALCTRHYTERFGPSADFFHIKMNVDGNWHTFEADARAAIEAMREPTEEMRFVVAADWGGRTWRQYAQVIDAALK